QLCDLERDTDPDRIDRADEIAEDIRERDPENTRGEAPDTNGDLIRRVRPAWIAVWVDRCRVRDSTFVPGEPLCYGDRLGIRPVAYGWRDRRDGSDRYARRCRRELRRALQKAAFDFAIAIDLLL